MVRGQGEKARIQNKMALNYTNMAVMLRTNVP